MVSESQLQILVVVRLLVQNFLYVKGLLTSSVLDQMDLKNCLFVHIVWQHKQPKFVK